MGLKNRLHFPGLVELVTMAVMAGKTDRVTVKTNTRHSAVSQIFWKTMKTEGFPGFWGSSGSSSG